MGIEPFGRWGRANDTGIPSMRKHSSGFSVVSLISLIIIGLTVTTACSIDFVPNRVANSKNAVISFLVLYATVQSEAFKHSARYDDQLLPFKQSRRWAQLASAYDSVGANRYLCDFDVSHNSFKVSCSPDRSSRLRLSFYLDQTCAIRFSAERPVGPSSPQLRLDPAQERELHAARARASRL
jgi:hypothetical protein